jgi:hypothetical protein
LTRQHKRCQLSTNVTRKIRNGQPWSELFFLLQPVG